jgi:uncharacterized membrane protein
LAPGRTRCDDACGSNKQNPKRITPASLLNNPIHRSPADNSQGLQIHDRNEAQSRGDILRAALTAPEASWSRKLEGDFRVRRYLFDTRLHPAKDFSELNFSGRASAVGTAVRSVRERFAGQPLAGVLLFTDGNATDLEAVTALGDHAVPVYPVVLGRDDPIRDVSIQKVAVTQTSFEDAPVTIEATATGAGMVGTKVLAELYEVPVPAARVKEAGLGQTNAPVGAAGAGRERGTNEVASVGLAERRVGELTAVVEKDQAPLVFRFQVRPARPGVSFFRLKLSAEGVNAEAPEATLANNERTLAVDRGQGPYRVLYVSGRPNWEFKFLNRALADDDQVHLMALIRVAKRERKFEFKGYQGDASNPLFRGFDKKGEEVERYDQPVLVRLNTRDEAELRGGFPKTAEELYEYHALILDDVEAEFFTHEQKVLVEKYVSERGGGMLMLGGMESFHQGNYDRTPMANLLPVYVDRVPAGGGGRDYQWNFTREGWLQPWARLRSNERDERARLEKMPTFQVLNRVRDFKPGASVLATVTDAAQKEYPALVTQRYGRGRTSALLIGDMWRWGFRDEAMQRDLAKGWRQMVRWLVADVPQRVELVALPETSDGDAAMRLRVRARDKAYQALDNTVVQLGVRHIPGGAAEAAAGGTNAPASSSPLDPRDAIPVAMEAAASESGVAEAMFIPRHTGGYLAEVEVRDAQGATVGQAAVGWTSDPAAEEFRSLTPNRALLADLARRTGGRVLTLSELDEFVNRLPYQQAPITETFTRPFWHTPIWFLLALSLFVFEWGWRRWKGLA